MKLIWKLLRQHISIGQFSGYFLANLFGMAIILLGIQFYKDVAPLFTGNDSFMKQDYLIINKKVSVLGTFSRKGNTFSASEIEELRSQPFTKETGNFTSSAFNVSAGIGAQGGDLQLSTEMFFESVPDRFIDIPLERWNFRPEQQTIPIIIPRNYLNLYNFGFAQARNLPRLSEGVMGLIRMEIAISGNGKYQHFQGNIVGFSNRLNTILVPETFMEWANATFAQGRQTDPSRLIVEVDNPADERIVKYFREKGYETEGNGLDAGKTAYFLKLVTGIVLGIGSVITLLSFYILLLSVYLLLQKNTTKLENLLLLGYSPGKIALPYQLLTASLNLAVLLLALLVMYTVRSYYLPVLGGIGTVPEGSVAGSLLAGIALLVTVTLINCAIIRRKIERIGKR